MARLPSPALPLRHSRRVITEPDGFGDAVSGIELSVDFQRRQERASQVEQFQSPAWALDFGEANVRTRVRGVLAGGWGSFCFAMGPGEAIWNGEAAAPGTIALLPPGKEVDGRTAADYEWLTAAVPADVWNRCLALAGRQEDGPDRLTVCRLPPSVAERIKLRLQECRALLKGAATPWLMDQVAEAVTDSFTTACELSAGAEPATSSMRNRARLARRAEAWMRDHLAEPVQVPDLCLALHVSRRELEYAFRSVFDQSPRDHLETLRLNAIRRSLLQGDGHRETIIAIAYAHGIHHLGRFSASYRTLFGEKPSETRRR
ncbi:helix-turn-helix domain-containing protein [Luteolibacter soli]|uniref:Helix-turn-helix domain-containing protein n=1 Tax=Luteolibacter soli TaxID=3135280 RepID=A0ABU9ANC0_9BACT